MRTVVIALAFFTCSLAVPLGAISQFKSRDVSEELVARRSKTTFTNSSPPISGATTFPVDKFSRSSLSRRSSKSPASRKGPISPNTGAHRKGPEITFIDDALLRLKYYSKYVDPKEVAKIEKEHVDILKEHIASTPGVTSASITNLAHSTGSKDKNLHITAKLYGPDKKLIPSTYMLNGVEKTGTRHHIYLNKEDPSNLQAATQNMKNKMPVYYYYEQEVHRGITDATIVKR